MIQRYKINYNGLVDPCKDGVWCMSEDVEKLEKQNKKLIEALENFVNITEIFLNYKGIDSSQWVGFRDAKQTLSEV